MFDPWVGTIPWRRERLFTLGFWPGEFHELYSPWGLQRVGHNWATFSFFTFQESFIYISPLLMIYVVNIIFHGVIFLLTLLMIFSIWSVFFFIYLNLPILYFIAEFPKASTSKKKIKCFLLVITVKVKHILLIILLIFEYNPGLSH